MPCAAVRAREIERIIDDPTSPASGVTASRRVRTGLTAVVEVGDVVEA